MKFETLLKISIVALALILAAIIASLMITAEWLVWNHLLVPAFGWPHQSWLRVWMWGIVISWALYGVRRVLRG